MDAIEALRAGRHVLCEKPLSVDSAEAERLPHVQCETELHVSDAIMVRYHPRWLATREIVRSGRLGQVKQTHAAYRVMSANPDDIRSQPQLAGGALGDVGIYPITAALRQAWSHRIVVIGSERWMEIPVAVWPAARQETVSRIRGRDDLNDSLVETLRFPPTNQYDMRSRNL